MAPNQIPPSYQRPPNHLAAEATDKNPLYYLAEDPSAGATPLYSVYELGSGTERKLAGRAYLDDAARIIRALRTVALMALASSAPSGPPKSPRRMKDTPQA